jgi:branched-chain amino acid transport system ATP-binding protein
MLRVSDLHVRYGSVAALRGVSLEVAAGEAVGLVGPNGAGKSSTLSAIVGLVRPAQGSVVFEGDELTGRAPEAISRRGLALVPEGRQIFGTLTVAENLRLGRAVRGRDPAFASDVERVLELFPVLARYHGQPAGKLSGGEQQMLAIARALVLRPRLLLLDEPSLGLAPQVVAAVFDVLERLRAEGVTILLVEQVVGRTVAFADRTYVLRNGRIALAGTRAELSSRADITSVYMGFEAAPS